MSREIPAAMLDGDWLSQRDRDVFLWDHPASGHRFVGLGGSTVHYRQGSHRFGDLSSAVAATFSALERLDDTGPGPRFVGGFGFSDDDPPSEGVWGGFPAACMVMPETCLISEDGKAWVVATTTDDGLGPDEARSHLERRIEELAYRSPATADSVPVVGSLDEGGVAYRALVAKAAAAISAGEYAKLVVARAVSVDTAANPDRILEVLRERYPACVTFAVTSSDRVFLGATPEVLVAKQGRSVRSVALAGTIARGSDSGADDDLAGRLRADPKEREEHEHVVAGIRASFDRMGVDLARSGEPGIRKLATVQHLETRISGMAEDASLIDLVGALHPTPAVGGLPNSRAAQWIAQHEGLDRGWYSGPLGYVDAAGDGEFHVALRCALIEGGIARCFVGAGIVAGSDPDRELAETTAKLRAIAESLAG